MTTKFLILISALGILPVSAFAESKTLYLCKYETATAFLSIWLTDDRSTTICDVDSEYSFYEADGIIYFDGKCSSDLTKGPLDVAQNPETVAIQITRFGTLNQILNVPKNFTGSDEFEGLTTLRNIDAAPMSQPLQSTDPFTYAAKCKKVSMKVRART
jgi:hypothetical protein